MTARRSLTTPAAPTLERGDHWSDAAACIGHERLFDRTIDAPNDADAEAEALTLCVNCPVMGFCQEANMGLEWGVVGGLTATERRSLRRKTARTRRKPKPQRTDEATYDCPACDFQSSLRGIGTHWRHVHADETGTCINNHPRAGSGRCERCRQENNAARYYAKRNAS